MKVFYVLNICDLFRSPSVLLGTILLASQLSPTYISPRFRERVERLARYKLEGGKFVEVGFTEEELETDSHGTI